MPEETQHGDVSLAARERRLEGITKEDIFSFSYKVLFRDKPHVKVSEECDDEGIPLVLMKSSNREWGVKGINNKLPKVIRRYFPKLVNYLVEKRVSLRGLREFNQLKRIYQKDPDIVPKPLLFSNRTLYMECLRGERALKLLLSMKTKEEIEDLIEAIVVLVQKRNDVGIFQSCDFKLHNIVYDPVLKKAYVIDFDGVLLIEEFYRIGIFFRRLKYEMQTLRDNLIGEFAVRFSKAEVEISKDCQKEILDRIDNIYKAEIKRLGSMEKEHPPLSFKRKIVALAFWITGNRI